MTIETHPYAYQEPPEPISPADVILNREHAPRRCANYHCHGNSGFLNTPFCDDCIWRLWAHIDGKLPEKMKELAKQERFDAIHYRAAVENARKEQWRKDDSAERRNETLTTPGDIYYLSIGDLIKIGFTTDFEQRMRQYPPNSTLLARHPGTRKTERQMHHKFLQHRSKGREWFTPCDEITEHIKAVREQFAAA